MSELSEGTCIPCKGGVAPLKGEALIALQQKLGGDWQVADEHHLSKTFRFKNFVDALAFVNRVGAVAESEDHHPDIHLAWGMVRVVIWTHAVDGLTENDFILAAKIDALG